MANLALSVHISPGLCAAQRQDHWADNGKRNVPCGLVGHHHPTIRRSFDGRLLAEARQHQNRLLLMAELARWLTKWANVEAAVRAKVANIGRVE